MAKNYRIKRRIYDISIMSVIIRLAMLSLAAFTLGESKIQPVIIQGEDKDRPICNYALGMELRTIPDHALTSSSSFASISVGPQSGRIRTEINGGAWCPRIQIGPTVKEYLEIDLEENHLVTATETQGRFGNGQGQEYAEHFYLEYWRPETDRWTTYYSFKESMVLDANTNTYLAVTQELDTPFVASKVRFYPFSEHPRTVCMRVELYGCGFDQGLVSYWAPRGEAMKMTPGVLLHDVGYDGVIGKDGMQRGGLGQLVDTLFGEDDFEVQEQGDNFGSRWVGWFNKSLNGRPLEIVFEFDNVRAFNTVDLHTNNMFTKDVQVFYNVNILFSIDGKSYQDNGVYFKPRQDRFSESARHIKLSLAGHIGKYVLLRFSFAHDWILLSEIIFDTDYFEGNITEEFLREYHGSVTILQFDKPMNYTEPLDLDESPSEVNAVSLNMYIGLGIGALLFVALVIGCVVGFVVRHGRQRVALMQKKARLDGHFNKRSSLPSLKKRQIMHMGEKPIAIDMRERALDMRLAPIGLDLQDRPLGYDFHEKNFGFAFRDRGVAFDLRGRPIPIGLMKHSPELELSDQPLMMNMHNLRHTVGIPPELSEDQVPHPRYAVRTRSVTYTKNRDEVLSLDEPNADNYIYHEPYTVYPIIGSSRKQLKHPSDVIRNPRDMEDNNLYTEIETLPLKRKTKKHHSGKPYKRTSSSLYNMRTSSGRSPGYDVYGDGEPTSLNNLALPNLDSPGNPCRNTDHNLDPSIQCPRAISCSEREEESSLQKQWTAHNHHSFEMSLHPCAITTSQSTIKSEKHHPHAISAHNEVTPRVHCLRSILRNSHERKSPEEYPRDILQSDEGYEPEPDSPDYCPIADRHKTASFNCGNNISKYNHRLSAEAEVHGETPLDESPFTSISTKDLGSIGNSLGFKSILLNNNSLLAKPGCAVNINDNTTKSNIAPSSEVVRLGATIKGNAENIEYIMPVDISVREAFTPVINPGGLVVVSTPATPNDPPPPNIKCSAADTAFYPVTDIVSKTTGLIRREQHFTTGRFSCMKLPENSPPSGITTLLEFPRDRIHVIEKLGEGKYGTLHLCEAERLSEYTSGKYNDRTSVIAKQLWRGATPNIRDTLIRDTTWLVGIRHENLARVLGLCLEEPPCAFSERTEGPDLPQFLRERCDDTESSILSTGCLIYLSMQVAAAMQYLETLELVHRDLAARNCMMTPDFVVKLSDHAMYCDEYEEDYFMDDSKTRLPVRWMSWESLLMGRSTTRSDVWSFGVTVWEIMFLCNKKPLGELSPQEVITNADHWYRNTGAVRSLPRPTLCPRDLYDLMKECWRRNESDRPTFVTIHNFLERMNGGYTPAAMITEV